MNEIDKGNISNDRNKGKPGDFKIFIDDEPYEWTNSIITGAQIKELAGVDPSFGVWQIFAGPEADPPIGDDQKVNLTASGAEKFFTGKKKTTEGS